MAWCLCHDQIRLRCGAVALRTLVCSLRHATYRASNNGWWATMTYDQKPRYSEIRGGGLSISQNSPATASESQGQRARELTDSQAATNAKRVLWVTQTGTHTLQSPIPNLATFIFCGCDGMTRKQNSFIKRLNDDPSSSWLPGTCI